VSAGAALDLARDEARDVLPRVPLWEFAAGTRLQSLVIAASKDPNAKLTVLLVSPESGLPVLAVKAPTTAKAERAVAAEMRVLTALHAGPIGTVDETIPMLVDVVDFEQRTAAVMTALPGRPMSTSYSRRRHTRNRRHVAADLAAVEAWLAELQSATAREHAPLDMDGGVAGRLRERFADDARLEIALERLSIIHERLCLDRIPRTVVHGDFWFGNILLSDGRVSGVVDWEAASLSGEPVRDLVRFANMYALYLDRRARGRHVAGHRGLRPGTWGAGLEYAICGSGWFPALYRQFLEDGLRRLGAAPESWRDAAVAGIAEVAALTDHDDFARLHLQLFARLAEVAA
jgi:aminoglycoside phosphotransferase (APT) family kinase protein